MELTRDAKEFRFLLYFGALSMLCSLVLTGVGLLRGLRQVAAF
jgi:Tfp pilus assembly protein PilN